MRPRFILLALIIAAVLWPLPGQAAAQPPIQPLTIALSTSTDVPVYRRESFTLFVFVSTPSPTTVVVDVGPDLCFDPQSPSYQLLSMSSGVTITMLQVGVRATAPPGLAKISAYPRGSTDVITTDVRIGPPLGRLRLPILIA